MTAEPASASISAHSNGMEKELRKRRRPKVKRPHAVTLALEARDAAVRSCALDHGIGKGGKRVEVTVDLTINHSGQVFRCDVRVDADVGGEEVRGCVEGALKANRYPATKNPFTHAHRRWQFRVE